MPNRYHLTQQELDELEYEHCHTSDKRYADRIKGVYLLGSGWLVGRAARSPILCDNARYYHTRLVQGYPANSRIEMVFLPPYFSTALCPNLH